MPPARDGIVVDLDTWPLVRFNMIGTPQESDWLQLFSTFDELYRRRERFAVLNDTSQLSSAPSAAIRQKVADRAKAHEPQSKLWIVHSATVVSNPILRGAMTALNWLAPPVYKQTVHGTPVDAVNALVASLQQEGIAISATLRTFREALVESK
jgi:hypothetical protein